jgi:hypothetical protein
MDSLMSLMLFHRGFYTNLMRAVLAGSGVTAAASLLLESMPGDEGCLDVIWEGPQAPCFCRVAFLGVSFNPPESSL